MSEYSKLLWRCRRGVKELDVVFTRFVDSSYKQLNETEKQAFSRLIDLEDPEILAYMLGQEIPKEMDIAEIVDKIKHNI